MEWVKMRCDIFEHRKIKLLRKGPKGDALALLWVMLIAEAGKCGRGGAFMISENTPYTAETLSLLLAIPESVVEQGLELFSRLEMIERDAGIRIRNWRKILTPSKKFAKVQTQRTAHFKPLPKSGWGNPTIREQQVL